MFLLYCALHASDLQLNIGGFSFVHSTGPPARLLSDTKEKISKKESRERTLRFVIVSVCLDAVTMRITHSLDSTTSCRRSKRGDEGKKEVNCMQQTGREPSYTLRCGQTTFAVLCNGFMLWTFFL